MKKIIGLVALLAVFIGGSMFAYNYFYGGETYYTEITTNGEKHTELSDNGESYTTYTYKQNAYNKNGEAKRVTLNEARERPLKLNAYLKLKVNPRKGVMSWEEVKETDIPKEALEKME
ncbi:YxeA family protein [Candidatus Enterococcus courvalinii]|uniref:YxeA family protein n=1 Tax=Candidatus Enterococcus courvalinii TaxID=2815329 RepID=A0ABS3HZT1_9ENTE|nr:YxeA family protein [Enterococcus sp. MSG2901]MBO0481974.1 YxeA family protein [Enterococcus sp. MSG2901]